MKSSLFLVFETQEPLIWESLQARLNIQIGGWWGGVEEEEEKADEEPEEREGEEGEQREEQGGEQREGGRLKEEIEMLEIV